MYKKALFIALCSIATYSAASPSLHPGAVVCKDLNSVRQAHAVATANSWRGRLPSQCVKTREQVSLVSSSVVGQLARIEVVANGNVRQMWTLPLYIKD